MDPRKPMELHRGNVPNHGLNPGFEYGRGNNSRPNPTVNRGGENMWWGGRGDGWRGPGWGPGPWRRPWGPGPNILGSVIGSTIGTVIGNAVSPRETVVVHEHSDPVVIHDQPIVVGDDPYTAGMKYVMAAPEGADVHLNLEMFQALVDHKLIVYGTDKIPYCNGRKIIVAA